MGMEASASLHRFSSSNQRIDSAHIPSIKSFLRLHRLDVCKSAPRRKGIREQVGKVDD